MEFLSPMYNIKTCTLNTVLFSCREYVIGHFEHLRYLDDKPVAALERNKYVRMEEPSFMEDLKDTVENFFHDITSSLVVKVNKKFNSIV
ncbi:hypothetical protein CDAR_310591 [Caerostris darwini]|uniref:Uncharacterized protein n=1 Tax=Caerostris darwini TaxID=1538125 RepID=A0AAV4WRZ5_9ARAC|nr:hypothetical protein CDAR_310591 [Caerostris darwini]